MNEAYLIMQRFFDGASSELLREGFADLLVRKDVSTEIHRDIETAFLFFLALPGLDHMYKVVGLGKLYELLGSPPHREVLASDYDFDDRAFQTLGGKADAFRPLTPPSPPALAAIPHISTLTLAREMSRRLLTKLRR